MPGARALVTLHARAPGESAARKGPDFPARAITTAVPGDVAVCREAGEEAEGAPLGDAWCRGGVTPGGCARGPGHGWSGSSTSVRSESCQIFLEIYCLFYATSVASVTERRGWAVADRRVTRASSRGLGHGRGPAARRVRDRPGRQRPGRAPGRAGDRGPGGVPAPAARAGRGRLAGR